MRQKQSLLRIEDNEGDRSFFKQALKTAGVLNPLFIAGEGQKAIDYLFRAPILPIGPDSSAVIGLDGLGGPNRSQGSALNSWPGRRGECKTDCRGATHNLLSGQLRE